MRSRCVTRSAGPPPDRSSPEPSRTWRPAAFSSVAAASKLSVSPNSYAFGAPIVSVSLGVPASFLWGGATRSQRPRRVRLEHGDVVVWGGPARLHFHGVDTLREAHHPLTGSTRFNLTFRRALLRR